MESREDFKGLKTPGSKQFQVDGYYFKFQCDWGGENALLLKFCSENGWDHEKLKSPFRAECNSF